METILEYAGEKLEEYYYTLGEDKVTELYEESLEIWLMTEEEKKILLELFPEADIGYGHADQLIIYTGRYAENQIPVEDWSDELDKLSIIKREEKWKNLQ